MLRTVATTRPARADDASFLENMLVEAVNWNSERARISDAEVLARPDFAHYVEGWPRDGDVGVVAEDEHGEPVGAAWYRHLSDDDPGYGFIDPSIPEVTIGVVARRRGQGVGRDLLEALAAEASRAGVTALSLSVETANPAMRLYRRQGYVVVREIGDAATLRLDLNAE